MVERTVILRGDNAQMATVSFVDDLQATVKPVASAKKEVETIADVKPATKTATKPAAKKPVAKKEAK